MRVLAYAEIQGTYVVIQELKRRNVIRVASRTSSFSYRDSTLDIPEISKALNVGHILEGSVRKDGDRIRITAQLIEAGTDTHLWSGNFDRELTDIFAIQDEIANAIVNALTGKLGMGGDKAITVEAVADEWIFGDGIDHAPLAKVAAEKALSLNPNLSMPLAVLGSVAEGHSDVVGGLDYYAAAIEKDPKNTTAWLWQGLVQMEVGFIDEAMASLTFTDLSPTRT